VVLKTVPAHATVAGVPAKVMRIVESDEPSRSMDQTLSDLAYRAFNYTI
jgi:serine O-acetyltransferase